MNAALISTLNYQISASLHLLYVTDGLLLKSLDIIVLKVLCKQCAAHLKCVLFHIFARFKKYTFACAKLSWL